MRVTKDPEERKNEILDTAERLFYGKGYEAATVNDILEEIKIAKGTFYYYFKSKEEVLDALIERRILYGVEKARQIIAQPLPPVQKLLAVIMEQKPQEKEQENMIAVLHEKNNSKMHVKSITQTIIHLAPCLADVIKEGIDVKIFNTQYPLECAEFLLASALMLFDDDFFKWQKKELNKKIAAFLITIERTLGAKSGSCTELLKAFS